MRHLLLGCFLIGTIMTAQDTKNFPALGQIIRHDPGLDQLIAPGSRLEVLASGFDWSESAVTVLDRSPPASISA